MKVTLPPLRDTITCHNCGLSQYLNANNRCPRCRRSLGVSYLEIGLPEDLCASDDALQSFKSQLASLLRDLRIRRGLTQAQLSHALKIGRCQVSRIEHGHRMPLRTLLLIAAKLGIDSLVVRIRERT